MNRLPRDFEIIKYGLHCRLVNEGDSAFIVNLRSDGKRSRFIHRTEADVEKQVLWIRDYKIREQKGQEYYFIYEANGMPFGVNRVYNIEEDHCTEGSWVCLPLEDSSKIIASALVIRDIIFDYFNFEYDLFNVSVGNNKVKKFHKICGATIIEETPEEYLFQLKRDDYLNNRQWFIETYNLK